MMLQVPGRDKHLVPGDDLVIYHQENKLHTKIFTAMNTQRFQKSAAPHSTLMRIQHILIIQRQTHAESKQSIHAAFHHHENKRSDIKGKKIHLNMMKSENIAQN